MGAPVRASKAANLAPFPVRQGRYPTIPGAPLSKRPIRMGGVLSWRWPPLGGADQRAACKYRVRRQHRWVSGMGGAMPDHGRESQERRGQTGLAGASRKMAAARQWAQSAQSRPPFFAGATASPSKICRENMSGKP